MSFNHMLYSMFCCRLQLSVQWDKGKTPFCLLQSITASQQGWMGNGFLPALINILARAFQENQRFAITIVVFKEPRRQSQLVLDFSSLWMDHLGVPCWTFSMNLQMSTAFPPQCSKFRKTNDSAGMRFISETAEAWLLLY